jgi:translation initiation factor 4G
VLLRKARGILNKLCPQKFDILVDKFNELQIDTEDKLRVCMELVFEKVILIYVFLIKFGTVFS